MGAFCLKPSAKYRRRSCVKASTVIYFYLLIGCCPQLLEALRIEERKKAARVYEEPYS